MREVMLDMINFWHTLQFRKGFLQQLRHLLPGTAIPDALKNHRIGWDNSSRCTLVFAEVGAAVLVHRHAIYQLNAYSSFGKTILDRF